MNIVTWTPEMIDALRKLRGDGLPIYWCAADIGVSYTVALKKCRELGLADRRNKGRHSGAALAQRATS